MLKYLLLLIILKVQFNVRLKMSCFEFRAVVAKLSKGQIASYSGF